MSQPFAQLPGLTGSSNHSTVMLAVEATPPREQEDSEKKLQRELLLGLMAVLIIIAVWYLVRHRRNTSP